MANRFVSSASGAGGAGNGTSWANAFLSLSACIAGGLAAGDTVWVGDDHAAVYTAATTLAFPGTLASPVSLYCVDHNAASPGTGDIKVGVLGAGSEQTTGTFNLTTSGFIYANGIWLAAGVTSTANCGLQLNTTTAGIHILENCGLEGATTGIASALLPASGSSYTLLINGTVKFRGISNGINGRAHFHWRGGVLDCSVVSPATVFTGNAGNTKVLVEDVDFSQLSGSSVLVGNATTTSPFSVVMKRCKTPSSGAFVSTQTAGGMQNTSIDFVQCDGGSAVYRNERYNASGSQVTVTNPVRTGGAAEGSVGIAWKLTSTSSAKWVFHFTAWPIAIWNAVTGSNINITIEGIADPRDFSALPKNDEVWFDAEYLGTSGNPLGVTVSGTKANGLATAAALTASTAAWDGAATARANSTVYALGAIIKTASNAGRVFVCTTAGTSASSEPAGYASAVDGGTVTDGTATFKAMWRFKQTLTTTSAPTYAGHLSVVPKLAKASVAGGVYIDPLIALS